MKKLLFFFVVLTVITGTWMQRADAQTTQKIVVPQDVERWITSSFGRSKLPPFTFVYGDKHSSGFIRKWKHTLKTQPCNEANVVKYLATYTDPATGLEIKCDISGFKEFNAVEWVLYFTNTSDYNTPQIKDVKVTDYTMQSASPILQTFKHKKRQPCGCLWFSFDLFTRVTIYILRNG
jgi:alpha-galactosidase